MSQPRRLLAVSNGHGEDDITCKILDALALMRPDIVIEAWPMVGTGERYRALGIPTGGAPNTLPGEGFGTLSAAMFLRDLRRGFVRTHWQQYRHAHAIRGRYDLLLGVGDIMPLGVATVSRTPMAFVACAKSAYYEPPDGHTPLERRLMRRHCRAVFARDQATADGFARTDVPCAYLGNPMMDGLGPATALWPVPDGAETVLMLAGSRKDAPDNLRLLMAAASALATRQDKGTASRHFLLPLHPSVPGAAFDDLPDWQRETCDTTELESGRTVHLRHTSGAMAQAAVGGFGAMARTARLAVGLAGTANEQAIGLGLPLITLPGAGNQGPAYVRMKMRYFGEAAMSVPRDAGAVAEAAEALLGDPARRAKMAEAGRLRMGEPGASRAIAARVSALLPARSGEEGRD